MLRRLSILSVLLAVILTPTALAANVSIRVEGKTTTIFGAAQPRLAADNALQALDVASTAGEFYYGTTTADFGTYVSQIGKYAAAGTAGWVFKVNGVSPPVGADKVTLKDGDVVLWYYATFGPAGGPPTLELQRLPANCYVVQTVNDAGKKTRAATATLTADGKRFKAQARPRLHRQARRGWSGLSRPAPSVRTRCGDPPRGQRIRRPCPPRRLRRRRRRGEGTAQLWVTRDRGAKLLVDTKVEAGQTLMRALASETDVKTRYGGRYVQAVNGIEGSLSAQRDWFWFVNGYEGDRSAASYRLHDGDVAWLDYRGWQREGEARVVVGAFPEPFVHGYGGEDAAGRHSLRTRLREAGEEARRGARCRRRSRRSGRLCRRARMCSRCEAVLRA